MAARDGELTLKTMQSIQRPAAAPSGPASWGGGRSKPMVQDGFAREANNVEGFLRPERGPGSMAGVPSPAQRPVAPATQGITQLPTQTVYAGRAPATSAPAVQTLPTQIVRPTAGIGMQSTGIPGISEITGNPDGSRTFTDRPDGTMAALATRGTLRRPDAVPTSERDAYLANVPTLGAGGMPQITRPTMASAGGVSPLMAQRFAQSDAIAVANEDPRSAAGTAARNARLRRDYAGPQTRTQREGSARAYEQTIAGLVGPGAAGIGAATELARTQMGESGANQRAMIGADAAIQQARITRPRDQFQQVTLEDGTLAQVGENGLSRQVIGADGQPVRPQRGRAPTDQAAYAKLYQDNFSRLLGADPVTGMITDPDNPKQPRQPTPQEMQQATAAARTLTTQALGGSNEGEVFVDAEGNRARLINGQYVAVE